jgi:hypothetical protein
MYNFISQTRECIYLYQQSIKLLYEENEDVTSRIRKQIQIVLNSRDSSVV